MVVVLLSSRIAIEKGIEDTLQNFHILVGNDCDDIEHHNYIVWLWDRDPTEKDIAFI